MCSLALAVLDNSALLCTCIIRRRIDVHSRIGTYITNLNLRIGSNYRRSNHPTDTTREGPVIIHVQPGISYHRQRYNGLQQTVCRPGVNPQNPEKDTAATHRRVFGETDVAHMMWVVTANHIAIEIENPTPHYLYPSTLKLVEHIPPTPRYAPMYSKQHTRRNTKGSVSPLRTCQPLGF